MKLVVYNASGQGTAYSGIKNLRFSPQVDICGLQAIADKISCDIKTTADIPNGGYVKLMNDNETDTYINAVILSVSKKEDGLVSIEAESALAFLDSKKMPAKMYVNVTLADAVFEVEMNTKVIINFSSTALSQCYVNGFAPEQTARERLTWLSFACNAFVRTSFTYSVEVMSLPVNPAYIPYEKTYWKPRITKGSYVTKINLTYFSFVRDVDGDDPDAETVTDGNGVKWIVTRTPISIADPSIPPNTPPNEVSVNDVMLVNSSNYSQILTMLTQYYFGKLTVEADIINNFMECSVGNKELLHLNETEMVTGFVEQMDYSFGLQTKCHIKLGACVKAVAGKLTLKYVCQDEPHQNQTVAERTFYFPVGYQFTVNTEYVEASFTTYDYVFRPAVATVSGTMSSNTVKTVNCYTALAKNRNTGVLIVVSVDKVTRVEKTESGNSYYIAEID